MQRTRIDQKFYRKEMISEVNDWLKDPNRKYSDGVDLYARFGKSPVILKILKKGENFYTKDKLLQELTSLKGQAPPSPKVIKISQQFQVFSEPKNKKIDREKLPPRLRELDIKKAILFKEMSSTGALMRGLPEVAKFNEQRRKLAERIEVLNDAIDAIWKQLDYWLATGKEMPEAERTVIETEKPAKSFKEMDRFDLLRKRGSLMSQRTRAKKRNDTALYAKLDSEIKQINSLISE